MCLMCSHLHKPSHPQITDGQVDIHIGNYLLCSHRSPRDTVQDSVRTHQHLLHTNAYIHAHIHAYTHSETYIFTCYAVQYNDHKDYTAYCVIVSHMEAIYFFSESKDSCVAHPCSSSSS